MLDAIKDGSVIASFDVSQRSVSVLGRHSQLADIVADHASISRQHCAIVHGTDGGVYAVDLKSAHGSFVNGTRLVPNERVLLMPGDRVTLGGSSRNMLYVC